MAIYPEIPDEADDMNEYSYIRPDSYVILRERDKHRPSSERLTYSQVYKTDNDDNVYEEIIPSVPPRSPTKKCSTLPLPPVPKREKRSKSLKEPDMTCPGNDVGDLTVAELGERLKLLKMNKYVKKFEKEGIDGSILVEMDETILKKEFGFKEFEAIKLRKFVQSGHIPR